MLFLILLPFGGYFALQGGAWHYNPIILTPLGLLSGLCYWIGYKIQWTLKLFGIVWCEPLQQNTANTSWSEFLTGAFAFGLPLAILC